MLGVLVVVLPATSWLSKVLFLQQRHQAWLRCDGALLWAAGEQLHQPQCRLAGWRVARTHNTVVADASRIVVDGRVVAATRGWHQKTTFTGLSEAAVCVFAC